MLFDLFRVNRLERAEPDIERQLADFDSPAANAFENLRREMQPGCRRGNRSGAFGENGLITIAVRHLVSALDVRRQRDMPEPIEQVPYRLIRMRLKPQRPQPQISAAENFSL